MFWLKTRFIAYGFLLGTAGVKALGSKEAKDFYTKATALGLRCGDDVMKNVTNIKEEFEDILADAKIINEDRKEQLEQEIIEDTKKKTNTRKKKN